VVDEWVGDYLDKAPLSLVEIRTLGGAARVGSELPSGNRNAIFFADMIVSTMAAALVLMTNHLSCKRYIRFL
jgi:hypothetical protein